MNEQDRARNILCNLKDEHGLPLTTVGKRLVTVPYYRLNRFLKGQLDLMPEELAKLSKLYNIEVESAHRREKELDHE